MLSLGLVFGFHWESLQQFKSMRGHLKTGFESAVRFPVTEFVGFCPVNMRPCDGFGNRL